jgi:polyhydroxyalkanoate synthase
MQGYLVWSESIERLAAREDNNDDWERRARARYAAAILTGALAPTNFLPTNPAALKRAFETGGASLVRGAWHAVRDMATNGGMPSQVDTSGFEVGRNLAATPGAVVYREDIFELIQYTPATPTVRDTPLLMFPPQVNKYYFLDLAPGRSLTEYLVGRGVHYFTAVWRNPGPEHGHWGFDDFIAAQLRAIDVVLEITGSPDLNLLGVCAGGLTTALMLGYQAAHGDQRVRSASFAVNMIDSRHPNNLLMMATERLLNRLEADAAAGKVYASNDVAKNFAWMRPNDLVFNYVVSGWLMGEDPPAFDVLAWNNDPTRLSATFDLDLLTTYARNRAAEPGGLTTLGTPVDLAKVDLDSFVIAGKTDHITPWAPCYMTSQLMGGDTEVVVTSTGHIQTIVNPPGKPRASYWHGPGTDPDPETWLTQTATHEEGSWWPRYADWLLARSGDERPAPAEPGNDTHPAIEPAPGSYVHEK